jgi:hypothetical protein
VAACRGAKNPHGLFGPVPAETFTNYPNMPKDAQFSYLCQHFGLLWATVWSWDCKPVIQTGENDYGELDAPDMVQH